MLLLFPWLPYMGSSRHQWKNRSCLGFFSYFELSLKSCLPLFHFYRKRTFPLYTGSNKLLLSYYRCMDLLGIAIAEAKNDYRKREKYNWVVKSKVWVVYWIGRSMHMVEWLHRHDLFFHAWLLTSRLILVRIPLSLIYPSISSSIEDIENHACTSPSDIARCLSLSRICLSSAALHLLQILFCWRWRAVYRRNADREEIRNISDEPIRQILHQIVTDIKKTFYELNVKAYDEINSTLKISSISVDKPYKKEFTTVFNNPVVKGERGRHYMLKNHIDTLKMRYFG